MRKLVTRAANIILRPEQEWPVIVREHAGWHALLFYYLVPLTLIAPIAYGARVLLGGEGSFHDFPTTDAALRFALLSVSGGFLASLLSVLAMSLALRLVAPLFHGRRDFADAVKVVTYAGTPVWFAGLIMVAPLTRFPLLVIVILIAIMHGLFLFYLGLHHVTRVPRADAVECTAIIVVAGVTLSSVVGYYASAAGLFPHL
jgi:hypothetical protein